jgi:hypothetical protein
MKLRLLAFFFLLTAPLVSRANIAVLGSLAQEYNLSAGDKFEGVIILRNNGNETETARVYQTDYVYAADGTNDFGAPGTVRRSNATWMAISSTLVQIPAGQTATINYKGRVPPKADLDGSYWSIVMIENTTALEGGKAGNGIKTLARYGVQVVTNIGETAKRSVKFAKQEFVRQDDKATAFLDLENDGDCLIFPKLWVELYDASGNNLGRFGGEAVRIYPTCSARYKVELPGIPAGSYNALVLVDCGHDQMVGTRVNAGL